MNRLIGRALVLSVVLLTATISFASENLIKNDAESVPGEYIVKFKPNIDVASLQVQTFSQETGSYIKSSIPSLNVIIIKRPVFELKSSVLARLQQFDDVEIVEPNFIYKANLAPNDPKFSELWGLKNYGQKDSKGQAGVPGIDVGAEQAWDIETGSKDVVVAVIDTGVNYLHPDLVENIWTNEAEANGKPGVDDDENGFIDDVHGYNFVDNTGDPMDDHGHGSHCSGTIGGKGNDEKGIVGVAWNVRIMGVKFLSASGSGSLEGALKSIDYATKMGAKIMSNSWGGGGYSETLKQAIERANAGNALFVAAAGNESNNNDQNATYPASYDVPNVLAVAALNNRGQIASFSNYGKRKVHVGAPGVNIPSSVLGEGYASWSGTSMACPHVSGIAALVAAKEKNISNIELKNRIVSTAKPVAGLKNKIKSGGIANAYTALINEQSPVDPDDPYNWETVPANVSTAHPYENKAVKTFEVSVPGASAISIYFSRFETESKYDVVDILDSNGNIIETFSGTNSDAFTMPIQGDKATIRLTTDASVNHYGFDVTKLAFKR